MASQDCLERDAVFRVVLRVDLQVVHWQFSIRTRSFLIKESRIDLQVSVELFIQFLEAGVFFVKIRFLLILLSGFVPLWGLISLDQLLEEF